MAAETQREKPFGLPLRDGRVVFKQADWDLIKDFISTHSWLHSEPALASDADDPLLSVLPPYGALLMGFDFHLSPEGPKLIEVNTNAGGLASVFTFPKLQAAQAAVRLEFVRAVRKEYELAQSWLAQREPEKRAGREALKCVAIVDDNVRAQGLYPEMLYFAELLQKDGVACVVANPDELEPRDGGLFHGEQRVDLIYNRMTDFRLESAEHAHLRRAIVDAQVAITPHPAVYVRSADKRLLSRTAHAVVPPTFLLKEKTMDEWQAVKKDYVFKPPAGNASKGVYRGDKLSVAKLKTLSPETVVQKFVPPPQADDESKYDLRVFTRDTDVIGIASRHFTGQVMEMSSAKSGFQEALPEGVCCLPCLDATKCAEMLKLWMFSGTASAPPQPSAPHVHDATMDAMLQASGVPGCHGCSCSGCGDDCRCCSGH